MLQRRMPHDGFKRGGEGPGFQQRQATNTTKKGLTCPQERETGRNQLNVLTVRIVGGSVNCEKWVGSENRNENRRKGRGLKRSKRNRVDGCLGDGFLF